MANLILSRPQAQAHQALNVQPGSRLVLDFPPDQATLERAGDDLAFNFEDGSRIELTNFYSEFSREDLSDFEVNGELVGGEKFFDAFAPDLLPAAGPAQAARETHDSGLEDGGALMHGLDHLDGLDYSQAASSAPRSAPDPVSSPLGGGSDESGSGFKENAGPGESGGSGGNEPESGPYLDFVERITDTPLHIVEGEVSIDPVLHGELASVFSFGGLEQGDSLRLDVAYTDGRGDVRNYLFTWSDGALGIADAQGHAVDPEDLPFGIEVAGGLASFYKVAGIDPETGEYIYDQSHVLDVSATLLDPDGNPLAGSGGAPLQSGPHHLEADGALIPAQGESWGTDGGVHLAGGASTDYIAGGDHSDMLEGNLGADRLYGGAGDDILVADWKMDDVPGGDFTVSGDQLHGGSGKDKLYGALVAAVSSSMNRGTLTVAGNALDGGSGDDTLCGIEISTTVSAAEATNGSLKVTHNTLEGGAGYAKRRPRPDIRPGAACVPGPLAANGTGSAKALFVSGQRESGAAAFAAAFLRSFPLLRETTSKSNRPGSGRIEAFQRGKVGTSGGEFDRMHCRCRSFRLTFEADVIDYDGFGAACLKYAISMRATAAFRPCGA